jgi:RNA polymerase sigma factor (sigma-70 family)
VDTAPEPDFDEVLDRARAGDEEAWGQLYDSLAPQLLGYVRARGGHDAEAVVGDVFLHVARGIDGFAGTTSGFRSWVFVIATSRLLDERRRLRRKPTEPLETDVEELMGGTADVEADVEALAAAHAAADLLDVLTPDQRAVVALRVFGELTSSEVSVIVDKPLTAVKALYRRGLATLRRELGADAEIAERPRALVPSSPAAVSFVAHLAVTEKS